MAGSKGKSKKRVEPGMDLSYNAGDVCPLTGKFWSQSMLAAWCGACLEQVFVSNIQLFHFMRPTTNWVDDCFYGMHNGCDFRPWNGPRSKRAQLSCVARRSSSSQNVYSRGRDAPCLNGIGPSTASKQLIYLENLCHPLRRWICDVPWKQIQAEPYLYVRARTRDR